MTQTFIYLIYNKNKNEVKIGYAADPIKRLSQLQVGTTDVLSILSTFEGGVEEERYLHQTLQEYRLSGEWFMNDYVVLKTVTDFAFNRLCANLNNVSEIQALNSVKDVVSSILSGTAKSRITVSEILKQSQGLDKKFVAIALVKLGWERKTYKSKNVVYLKPKQ
jgi:hypothetical protein